MVDLAELFKDADTEITCPGCNKVISVSVAALLTDRSTIHCPSCGDIRIKHTDDGARNLRKTNRALADFEKKLKDLGRK